MFITRMFIVAYTYYFSKMFACHCNTIVFYVEIMNLVFV
jgi:hypothetical protein